MAKRICRMCVRRTSGRYRLCEVCRSWQVQRTDELTRETERAQVGFERLPVRAIMPAVNGRSSR